MGQCISVTDIGHLLDSFVDIRDNKKVWAHSYSRTALCFGRFPVALGHFPRASCAKHLLVKKASFLRKWGSLLVLRVFSKYLWISTEHLTEKKSDNNKYHQNQKLPRIYVMAKWIENNYFSCQKIYIFGFHLLEVILKVKSTCNFTCNLYPKIYSFSKEIAKAKHLVNITRTRTIVSNKLGKYRR